MENIMTLFTLYTEYLERKANDCMHRDDWKALERVKEIIANDFPTAIPTREKSFEEMLAESM